MKEAMCNQKHRIKITQESKMVEITLLEQRLSAHCGHDVQITKYGIGKGCYTLECCDCNEVVFDTDIYDLCAKEGE